jgi:hypothetical protein
MKCSMVYGANTYGNKTNAAEYLVKLKRGKEGDAISIRFNFDKPAEGRGIGYSRGSVRSVSFTLPSKTAEALSHALQLALAETASTDVEFRIEEQG